MREHTEAIRPPRALWASFIMGRPLGVPGDPAFQRRVLQAALALLEAGRGPVLEDYPEDAPVPSEDTGEGFACPVSFVPPVTEDGLAGELQKEIRELAPWHKLAVSRLGRTTATLSGLSPAAAAKFVADFIENPDQPSYRADISLSLALRLTTQDLKAYYLEAVASQPGARAALDGREWLWRGTAVGRAFLRLRDACLAHPDDTVKGFGARGLVPLAIAPRPEGADALRRY